MHVKRYKTTDVFAGTHTKSADRHRCSQLFEHLHSQLMPTGLLMVFSRELASRSLLGKLGCRATRGLLQVC